jgi:hypothetical protein
MNDVLNDTKMQNKSSINQEYPPPCKLRFFWGWESRSAFPSSSRYVRSIISGHVPWYGSVQLVLPRVQLPPPTRIRGPEVGASPPFRRARWLLGRVAQGREERSGARGRALGGAGARDPYRVGGRAVGADAGGQLREPREHPGAHLALRLDGRQGPAVVHVAHALRVLEVDREVLWRAGLLPRALSQRRPPRRRRSWPHRRHAPSSAVAPRRVERVAEYAPLRPRVGVPARRPPRASLLDVVRRDRREGKRDDPRAPCHVLFAQLPVHRFRCSPWDCHLFRDLCPHFRLESIREVSCVGPSAIPIAF